MTFKQIFTAVSAIMILAITACKTDSKDALTRKWKATDVTGYKVSAEQKKMLVDEQRTTEFRKDGSFAAG